MLMGAACAKQDLNLSNTVSQNLDWAQPHFDYANQPKNLDDYHYRDKSALYGYSDTYRPASALKPQKSLPPPRRDSMSDRDSMSSYPSSSFHNSAFETPF